VRTGETDRRKRRHRAPVRPYTFAWLHHFKRLLVRYEIHAAFLALRRLEAW
jgi:hypothetical protein